MNKYRIIPIYGRKARDYLQFCGCALELDLILISDTLNVRQKAALDAVFNVETSSGDALFQMRHLPNNVWSVMVPVQYCQTFRELVAEYKLDYRDTATITNQLQTDTLKLISGQPVPHYIAREALERFSLYTRKQYSFDNVKVVVSDD